MWCKLFHKGFHYVGECQADNGHWVYVACAVCGKANRARVESSDEPMFVYSTANGKEKAFRSASRLAEMTTNATGKFHAVVHDTRNDRNGYKVLNTDIPNKRKTRLRFGFRGRNQIPLFMIWREHFEKKGVIDYAEVVFKIE